MRGPKTETVQCAGRANEAGKKSDRTHEHGHGHRTAGVQGPKTETVPRGEASEAMTGVTGGDLESCDAGRTDWEGEWRVSIAGSLNVRSRRAVGGKIG